jgi:hypothetical protein
MEQRFYYCLKHSAVEAEKGCKASDRLGPYPTRAEAEHALEKVRQRNEAWDNDPAWNDDSRT